MVRVSPSPPAFAMSNSRPKRWRHLRNAVANRDDFALAALHVLASITGSLVLGLAVPDGRLDAAKAFALSRLDEAYQAEKWGADARPSSGPGAWPRKWTMAAAAGAPVAGLTLCSAAPQSRVP